MVGEVDTGQIRAFLRGTGGRITMIDVPGSTGPITRAFDIMPAGKLWEVLPIIPHLGIQTRDF